MDNRCPVPGEYENSVNELARMMLAGKLCVKRPHYGRLH